MATWVRQGTGTAPTSTDADLTGRYSLDNDTAPPGFDPSSVSSVQIQYTITGSGFAGDTWTDLRAATLDNGSQIAADINGTDNTALGNTTSNTNETDVTPNTGLTTAQWEAMAVSGGILTNGSYTTWNQDKGKDGGVQTMSALTVTITYTPAPALVEQDWRLRNDGTETDGDWVNALTDPYKAGLELDTPHMVRFLIQETAGIGATKQFKLQYWQEDYYQQHNAKLVADNFSDVTTTTPIAIVASSNVTDGQATTQQLGAGTFVAGKICETDGTSDSVTFSGNDETEIEWVIKINTAAAGYVPHSAYYLRVVEADGTPLSDYDADFHALYVDTFDTDAGEYDFPHVFQADDLTFDNEGGTSGNAVTTSDTGSGDPWDGVFGTVEYSNAQANTGSLSMLLTGSTAASSYVEWVAMRPEAWWRAYMYFTAYPASGQTTILYNRHDPVGGTNIWRVRLNTSGQLEIYDQTAATVRATSTATVSLNQWIRLEVHMKGSLNDTATTGVVEVRLYNSKDSTTATESISYSSAVLPTVGDHAFPFNSNTSSAINYYADDIAFSVNDWIGPLGGGGTTVALGTLAQSDSLVAIQPIKPISTTITTLASSESPISIEPLKPIDASVGAVSEIENLISVDAVKPIIASIGSLTETDALLAIQALKPINTSVGELAENESLNPVTITAISEIGTLAELESLLAADPSKTVVVGLISETDTSISVGQLFPQTIDVTTVAELDGLIAISGSRISTIGTLAESDLLVDISGLKLVVLGVLSESESLNAVEALKPLLQNVGTLAQLDSLVAIDAVKTIISTVGTLSEINALRAIDAVKAILQAVSTLSESEALVAVQVVKPLLQAIGTLSEIASLLPVGAAKSVLVGTISEISSLLSTQAEKYAAIGTLPEEETLLAAETTTTINRVVSTLAQLDTLISVGAIRTIDIGTLSEISTLIAASPFKVGSVGTLAGFDGLLPIVPTKIAAVGTVTELDSLIAVALAQPVITAVGTLSQADLLNAITVDKPLLTGVGVLPEMESLVTVGTVLGLTIGTIDEIEDLIQVAPEKEILTGVGTIAELDALIEASGLKVVDIGTLSEIDSMFSILVEKHIGTLEQFDSLLGVQAEKPIELSVGTITEVDVLVAATVLFGTPALLIMRVTSKNYQSNVTSTENRTTAPSTENQTTAPSTENRTTAPSTENRTTAPSTVEGN